jgi:hypothetical protein
MPTLREAITGLVGLLFASLLLYFLDPVIAAEFAQPLTNPQFAASPAGGIWKVMEVLSDYNGEIIVAWVGYLIWLIKGDS